MENITRQIGDIGNYYGCLCTKEEKGKYFWAIENYDGEHWEEIPESLYNELHKFNNQTK